MRGDMVLMQSLGYMTDLVARLGEEHQKQIVTALLLALGVSPKKDGFLYLVWAVQNYRKDPGQSMTKELYPSVAAMFGPRLKSNAVEKSIRVTIDQAWRDCDEETWKLFFPAPGGLWARPSNTEFIARLACLLELWLAARDSKAG